MSRELYKCGWGWLMRVDGLFTMLKISILILAAIIPNQNAILLMLVMLLGVPATHFI